MTFIYKVHLKIVYVLKKWRTFSTIAVLYEIPLLNKHSLQVHGVSLRECI